MKMTSKVKNWEPIFLWRLLRARGWEAVRRHLQERNRNHCRILSNRPPTVLLWWGRDDRFLHNALRDVPLTVCYAFPWHLADDHENIAAAVRQKLAMFPNHRILLLCNEKGESEIFQSYGVDAIFCNQNSMVSEISFQPTKHSHLTKKWDAVYNAMMAPYKRWELAASVTSLCAITYRWQGSSEIGYEERIRLSLNRAYWANDKLAGGGKVSSEQVRELLCFSHCGLCLSSVEGAMFASMEYLLCGIPVVTTASQGGREMFFCDGNSLTVTDCPDAVAGAIESWKSKEPNPAAVRESAQVLATSHRERLVTALQSRVGDLNLPWRLPGPLLTFKHHSEIASLLRV